MESMYMSDNMIQVPARDTVSVPREEYIELLRKAAVMDILATNKVRSWELESFVEAAARTLYHAAESGDDDAE